MTKTLHISVRDRTKELIFMKKGTLSASEYIEQCLLNYWEMKRTRFDTK